MNGMNRIESEDAFVDLQLFAGADHAGLDVAVDVGHGIDKTVVANSYALEHERIGTDQHTFSNRDVA
jgi:hypothetical protein